MCVGLAAQTQPPSVMPAGNAQAGKDLYLRYSCYACHGYDGHGGAGARLVPMRMSLAGFTAYVHNPRQMPPYTAKVLSDAHVFHHAAHRRATRRRVGVHQKHADIAGSEGHPAPRSDHERQVAHREERS
jgi:cbb3-type cytochrome oxidase cytochrome c subunit